jgi:phosphatidylserine decarboxylase
VIGPTLAPEAATSVIALGVTALALLLAAVWSGRWPVWLLGLLACAAAVVAASVYRDPPRSPPSGADLVIAPADGRVLAIDAVDEPYLGGSARRIRIRARHLDLRILRSPVDGVVDYTEDADGYRLGLSTGITRVLLDLERRRPVIRVTEGNLLDRGQRMGALRAGGELTVLVPASLQLAVAAGQQVRSGESVLARLAGGR